MATPRTLSNRTSTLAVSTIPTACQPSLVTVIPDWSRSTAARQGRPSRFQPLTTACVIALAPEHQALTPSSTTAPASSAAVWASYNLARLRSCAATAASARQRCKVCPPPGRLRRSKPASTMAHSTCPALSFRLPSDESDSIGKPARNLRIAETGSLMEEVVISHHRRIGFAAKLAWPCQCLDELSERFVKLSGSGVYQREIRIAGRQHRRQLSPIQHRGTLVEHHNGLAMTILILDEFDSQPVCAQADGGSITRWDDQRIVQR